MKRILPIILLSFTFISLWGQQETPNNDKPKDLPVREPFLSGVLLDNQTTFVPVKNTFEYVIQHKFGTMDNGFKDVFGIYAPLASIRMGINYVPIKNMQIGYGLSKHRMYSDFSVKYTIAEQTRQNSMPVAITLYANCAIDARDKDVFGKNYTFKNRLAYFSQIILSRKFGELMTIQANGSFTHYNKTDLEIDHDKISIGVNGRIAINYKYSIIFQYDHPLKLNSITEHREFVDHPKPNVGIGWEIRTSAHVFQLFASSSDNFVSQHNTMFNQNDWLDGQLKFGFTITRLYNF
ncbi:DUF5777 family beta-barrel protein [Carboxylicivirga caseinilyticus]|uniref:DUF5777 family beta-barrel protein n=1 Tax=Carboxylicivirga caseinilyticus TaxID=3417572 RepID=UPI003D325EC4|nr:hypothetical protein [Marinilabiliaceae bacterium A049]